MISSGSPAGHHQEIFGTTVQDQQGSEDHPDGDLPERVQDQEIYEVFSGL
jgi:hypothetical protein